MLGLGVIGPNVNDSRVVATAQEVISFIQTNVMSLTSGANARYSQRDVAVLCNSEEECITLRKLLQNEIIQTTSLEEVYAKETLAVVVTTTEQAVSWEWPVVILAGLYYPIDCTFDFVTTAASKALWRLIVVQRKVLSQMNESDRRRQYRSASDSHIEDFASAGLEFEDFVTEVVAEVQ